MVVSEGLPDATVFYDPASGSYGFCTRHPHHSIATFDSVEEVIAPVVSALAVSAAAFRP